MPSDLVVQGNIVGEGDPHQASLFDESFYTPDSRGFVYSDEGSVHGIELLVEGRLVGPEVASSSILWNYVEHRDERRVYRGRPHTETSPELARFQRSVLVQANVTDAGLGRKISDLIVNKATDRLVEVLNRIDRRIAGLALGERGQVYVDVGLPALLPIGLMGEGVRRLISIVATIMGASGSLVLIDEIDDGLHHTALALLWQTVLDAALAYDVQVVTTTHSREALEQLTAVLERDDMVEFRQDVAAFDLVRGDDDAVLSYRYDFDQLDFALEHDLDVRS